MSIKSPSGSACAVRVSTSVSGSLVSNAMAVGVRASGRLKRTRSCGPITSHSAQEARFESLLIDLGAIISPSQHELGSSALLLHAGTRSRTHGRSKLRQRPAASSISSRNHRSGCFSSALRPGSTMSCCVGTSRPDGPMNGTRSLSQRHRSKPGTDSGARSSIRHATCSGSMATLFFGRRAPVLPSISWQSRKAASPLSNASAPDASSARNGMRCSTSRNPSALSQFLPSVRRDAASCSGKCWAKRTESSARNRVVLTSFEALDSPGAMIHVYRIEDAG